MSDMTAKEPVRQTFLRRLARPRAAIALVAAIIVIGVGQVLILPRLVAGRVTAALRSAGFPDAHFTVMRATLWGSELRDVTLPGGDRADRVEIGYSLADLWNGRLDRLRISGVRYTVEPPARGVAAGKSRSFTAQNEIPIRRIELVASNLVIAGSEPIELPVEAAIEKVQGRYRVTGELHVGDGLNVSGDVAHTLRDGTISATVANVDAGFIDTILTRLMPASGVELGGTFSAGGKATWSEKGADIEGRVTLSDATDEKASKGKLSVTRGVFDGVAHLNPTTRPSMTLAVSDADLATPDLSAAGVSGTVRLVDLSPPVTAPDQMLSAAKLKIGSAEFEDGKLQFQVNPDGNIAVRNTTWQWLGGEVAASNITIPPDAPVQLTLHARDVDLKRLLELLAKDKASGEGKLSGDIPVTIDHGRIEFGEAHVTALTGGTIQIKDAAAIVPTAEAAAQAAKSPSQAQAIKRNIMEALSDFQFDGLSAELKNEPDGSLGGYVHMSGQGRGGAKQRVEYDLRVHHLDLALKSYLNIQAAMDKMRPPPTTSTTRKASP